ncbi:reverse transcriptase-like protein [Elysia marginata]|uniref:Reverse transcriptase-like protein n=1 Tax=Elysia marginata TaxID=1093978 RepID=A0AAV4FSH4_9GAST|nr:reverse transcriptase-like protein [Elysia marginata]
MLPVLPQSDNGCRHSQRHSERDFGQPRPPGDPSSEIPWFNTQVKEAKRERRAAELKSNKTGLHVHREIFISARNRFNSVVSSVKRQHYLSKLSSAGAPCKSLSRVQVVQNNAARLIFKKKKTTSVSPLLKELHWLPIAERIDYKTCVLCFNSILNIAPQYLKELFSLYQPKRKLRSSDDSMILKVPRMNLKSFGDRAFSSYAPRIWNSLPEEIRNIEKLESFKK